MVRFASFRNIPIPNHMAIYNVMTSLEIFQYNLKSLFIMVFSLHIWNWLLYNHALFSSLLFGCVGRLDVAIPYMHISLFSMGSEQKDWTRSTLFKSLNTTGDLDLEPAMLEHRFCTCIVLMGWTFDQSFMKFLPGVEKLWTGHEICTQTHTVGRTKIRTNGRTKTYAVGDTK
jgi:hypothetical protein